MNAEAELDELLKERSTPRQEASWSTDKRWTWFWVAVLGASVPMLIPHLLGMWSYEHYRYLPFVFLVVGFLVWTRSDRILRPPTGWLGWTAVVVGIFGIVVSLILPSTWVAGVSAVVLASACIGAMRGPDDRNMLIAAVPLLMLIQLPIGLDTWLINRLQGVTTDLSSVVMDVLGIPHSISGNSVQLVSRELFVAEQCSGIQSVFTLAFIACVIVAINRRRLWLTPVYLVIAVLLALASNTIRVTTVAVAEFWFGSDLAHGWQHDVLGYVTLGIATALLLSFDQLVVTLLHPANVGGDSAMDSPLVRVWNYLVADWQYSSDDSVYGRREKDASSSTRSRQGLLDKFVLNRTGWYGAVGLLAVIGLGAAIQATRVEINQAPRQLLGSIVLFNPQPDLFAGEYNIVEVGEHARTRHGSDPTLGQNADFWKCKVEDLMAQAVVSQSYRGWHELCVCYENQGWRQLSREVTQLEEGEVEQPIDQSFITARFKRETDGMFGYLLYTAVNEDGSIPEAPDAFNAFGARFLSRLERHGLVKQQDLVMFQIWLVTRAKISPETLRLLQQDFVLMRDRVAQAIDNDAIAQTQTTSFSETIED